MKKDTTKVVFHSDKSALARMIKACRTCRILITVDELADIDDNDFRNVLNLLIRKGISFAWLMFGRGNMWYMENNYWTIGRPLSYEGQYWN